MRVRDENEAREADGLAADVVDRDVTSEDRDDVDASLAMTGCRGAPTGVSAEHSADQNSLSATPSQEGARDAQAT